MPDRRLPNSQVKTDSVCLPGPFFTRTMPGIHDLAELKAVLSVYYLALRKQDHPEAGAGGVTCRELMAEGPRFLAGSGENALRRALDSAVEHGALLRSASDVDGVRENVYSPALGTRQPPSVNIFALYEQNVGMITPMVAEELKEAENLYPPQWIEEAIREAVVLNKRNWRYIARILERWGSEGKDSGEHKGDAQKASSGKYIRGKYGHLVKR